MQTLYFLIIVVAIGLVSIMAGARFVNAERTGLGAAALASVALALFNRALAAVIVEPLLASAVWIGGAALLLSWVLGTSFVRGLVVAAIAFAIQFAGLFALAALFPDLSLDVFGSASRTAPSFSP